MEDLWVSMQPESIGMDDVFRFATEAVSSLSSPKALGDCYLLAISQVSEATLVTFDRGLAARCRKARRPFYLLETHKA